MFIKVLYKIFCNISYKLECLCYRFLYSRPKLELEIDFLPNRYLVCGGNDLNDNAAVFKKQFPDKVSTKIAEANLICEHVFDLLGSGPQTLSARGKGYQPIDWHTDFKSSYRWNPKAFFRSIRYSPIEGADIKVPWELSRFQHLSILGQAYLLTKDMKYLEEFVSQITDWVDNNPVAFGVNWNCTMDVAIRAVNWLVASEYFSNYGLLSLRFLNRLYNSIYDHGKFIRSHLERERGITNNHYIANLCGLFFVAVYCPFFEESSSWRDFALRELAKEAQKQIYPDGCGFEASTSYHRLVLEMLFYCELVGERAGVTFPQCYKDKVRKMFKVALWYVKPDGSTPQIGDNDSGRFVMFCRRPALEHKYLLNLGTIHYADPTFKQPGVDFDEESFWVFGQKGKEAYDQLPDGKDLAYSKAFADAGWFIIRHNTDYCFISCGPNGQNGNGAHAHNDKLSFELVLDGQDIIVDPGTYVYTADPRERNIFRSTEYHNTVKYDGYEQNELAESSLFRLTDGVQVSKACIKEMGNSVVFQGEVQYAGVRHKRRISLNTESGDFHIQDILYGKGSINGSLRFHLPPSLTTNVSGTIFTKTTDYKIAAIDVVEGDLTTSRYAYSPEYGVKVEGDCLIGNISITDKSSIINTHIRKCK